VLRGIGAHDPLSSIASSMFDSKADSAAAKARAQIATTRALAKARTTIALAKQDTAQSGAWKKWIPVLVLGAIAVSGVIALAASSRRKAKP